MEALSDSICGQCITTVCSIPSFSSPQSTPMLYDLLAQRLSLVPSQSSDLGHTLWHHLETCSACAGTPPIISSEVTMDQVMRPSSFPRSTDASLPPSSPTAFTAPESIASTATVSPHADKINLANQKPISYISWPGVLYCGTPWWLIVLYAIRL